MLQAIPRHLRVGADPGGSNARARVVLHVPASPCGALEDVRIRLGGRSRNHRPGRSRNEGHAEDVPEFRDEPGSQARKRRRLPAFILCLGMGIGRSESRSSRFTAPCGGHVSIWRYAVRLTEEGKAQGDWSATDRVAFLVSQRQLSKGELIMPSTIRLHRVLRSTPERVYRAFLDPEAKAKWLPPNGFTGKVHHIDARVGGSYKMSFTNFTTGKSHSFGGQYVELVPNERIRYTDKFDDPNLPGEMQVTVTLKKVLVGTELNIVQEGVPDVIPAEACYLGWQESLTLLTKLVEAEIPG